MMPGCVSFLSKAYKAPDFRVKQAHNGPEALEELRRQRPDLILVDFLMPGMNGIDDSKGPGIHPDLPVLLATGYADMNVVEKVIPPNRVLRKPFRSEELVTAVFEALAEPLAA